MGSVNKEYRLYQLIDGIHYDGWYTSVDVKRIYHHAKPLRCVQVGRNIVEVLGFVEADNTYAVVRSKGVVHIYKYTKTKSYAFMHEGVRVSI